MLEQYFSDERIIAQICKERVKLAGCRHDRHYALRLVGGINEPAPDHLYYQLLPPRREWSAFRPRNRTGGTNPDLAALKQAVRVLREQHPDRQWVVALNNYIVSIRERVLSSLPFAFSSPTINWIRKKLGKPEFRALCRFNTDDNLILCLFARYLCDQFDPLFSVSSFAFRSTRDGQVHSHHQAFDQLHDLRIQNAERDLYVAECDIMGFFDTVDHGVAFDAFTRAAEKVNLDDRAGRIFRAYLDCYSFPQNVLQDTEPRLKSINSDFYFKWPAQELAAVHHADPHRLRIGVAQGGAISGIIANLVMDQADKRVEQEQKRLGAETYYYRYCDDMVLISPNIRHCQQVFGAYLDELTRLKLVFHKPEATVFYEKNHWNHKSKAPYRWSGRKWFGCVPWLQFVGYQIRYDGLVRPRKEAVAKQCLNLYEAKSEFKHDLLRLSQTQQIQASGRQVLASLKHRLVAKGVGRVKGFDVGPKPMCWASGYRAMHNKPIAPGCFSAFDRARAKQIRQFCKIDVCFGDGTTGRGGPKRQEPAGYQFSYAGQFNNIGGLDLIRSPWRPGLLDKIVRTPAFEITRRIYNWKILLQTSYTFAAATFHPVRLVRLDRRTRFDAVDKTLIESRHS